MPIRKEYEPKLHPVDLEIIEAARTGEGNLIPLTPQLIEEIEHSLQVRNQEIQEKFPALVAAIPYESRLAMTAFIFKQICEHAYQGGSFRHLIYDRLGFGSDAYFPLYMAGGMEISNHFDMTQIETFDPKEGEP